MKALVVLILALLSFSPAALAATDGHESHRLPADYQEVETGPEVGEPIQKYAPDAQKGAQQNFGVQPVHDNELFYAIMFDRLEYQWRENENVLLWDVTAWVGSDWNKLSIESEGEWLEDTDDFEEFGVEVYYGRTIDRYWDLKIGLRHDFEPNPERTFAALGIEGLGPQWFEVEATLYVSEDGDVSAVLEAEYDLLLTQRLILQPRLEAGISLHDVPEYGQWEGITDVTLGLRLRYELSRKLAPYVGVTWTTAVGETANRIQDAGGDEDSGAVVSGVRVWF